jgi:hypothetical protein
VLHATPHPPTPADCQCAFLQSGSSNGTGDTTFYNVVTFSGSRQFAGKTDFYKISDGSSTTSNSVGSIDFYSGSRASLSGWTDQSDNTSTQQSVSGTTLHNFSNGRNCASSRVGTVDLGSDVSIGKIKGVGSLFSPQRPTLAV